MLIRAALIGGAAIVLASVVASSCQSRSEEAAAPAAQLASSAAAAERTAPTLEELKNATYRGVEEAGKPMTLAAGKWTGEPYEPGAASAPGVTYVRDFRLVGDLDGDGADEAAVLLAASAGGTGETCYLAVVGRPGGQVTNMATSRIGDRVQVRDAKIEGRHIVLDVVQAGDNDAACCPGDLVTRTWEFSGDTLKAGAAVKSGRLSPDALAGTEWVLRSWTWDEAAPISPEVTLNLDGARLAGNAGCNRYFAAVKAGASPGALTVGPAGSTRKMCPDAEMAIETRFLAQLAAVQEMRFVAGQLALSYEKPDKSYGVMLFDRRAAR